MKNTQAAQNYLRQYGFNVTVFEVEDNLSPSYLETLEESCFETVTVYAGDGAVFYQVPNMGLFRDVRF